MSVECWHDLENGPQNREEGVMCYQKVGERRFWRKNLWWNWETISPPQTFCSVCCAEFSSSSTLHLPCSPEPVESVFACWAVERSDIYLNDVVKIGVFPAIWWHGEALLQDLNEGLYPCSTKTREVLGNPSQRPIDFLRAKPEGNLEGRGKSWGWRGWFPIPPEFWWNTDILLIINPFTRIDQEIHPSGQGRIDRVKINLSLLRMRECDIYF